MRRLKAFTCWLLLMAIGLAACPSRAALAQLLLGTCYDALYHDSRAKRDEDRGPLKDAGFLRVSTAFTKDDEPALKWYQDNGVKVLFMPNGVSEAQQKAWFAAFPAIDSYYCVDDADISGGGKAAVVAKVTAARALIRPDMKTFLSLTKNADPAVWANISDIASLQLYIHGEGTIRKWYWDQVKAWRAVHTGQLWVHPYLGKRQPPFFGVYPKLTIPPVPPATTPRIVPLPPDPVWSAEEYTPLRYNEVAIWTALCAGADDVLFYSAFSISNALPKFQYRIAERWDLLPGYKSVLARIRFYERYLKGTRTPLPEVPGSPVVGAVWTLPSGESLEVRCDTSEWDPQVYFEQRAPRTATVTATAKGFNITFSNN